MFDRFWEAFPNKVGKGAARRAFAKTTVPMGDILAAIERYKATKPPDRPWCNPATWLNQERWLDAPAKPLALELPVDSERERWARRIQRWRETGFWLDNWGFPPSDPGCMAPADLLSEQAA